MEKPVVTEVKLEDFDASKPPAHLENTHESQGFKIRARNRYANKGIPELLKKMTAAVMGGGFDGALMNFPSNMYWHQSNGELAIQETAPSAYYLDKAATITDPVERMKYVTCASVSIFDSWLLTNLARRTVPDPNNHRIRPNLPRPDGRHSTGHPS